MQKNAGFTLIELLVVVLIIGILSAVALPQYQRAVDKARMTQALTWAKTIREAERVYYLANGEFTQNLEDLDISLPDCKAENAAGDYTCGEGWWVRLSDVPSIYVHLPTKVTGGEDVGIEYYLAQDQDTRLCFARSSSDRFTRLCASYGGSLFANKGGAKYYSLP